MEAYTKVRTLMHKRGHMLAKWNQLTLGTSEEFDAFDDIEKLDAEVRECIPMLLKEIENLRAELKVAQSKIGQEHGTVTSVHRDATTESNL